MKILVGVDIGGTKTAVVAGRMRAASASATASLAVAARAGGAA